MRSVSQLIAYLRELEKHTDNAGPIQLQIAYLAPTLHIDIVGDRFGQIDADERREKLSLWMSQTYQLPADFLDSAISGLPVAVNVLTLAEAEEKATWSQYRTTNSWVTSFLDSNRGSTRQERKTSSQQYVHFYGYKGGQARSSVLGLLAKAMADDGYNILIVDADIEAPSLDNLLGVFAENFDQTLMGLCGWGTDITPLAGAYTGRTGGRVDVLPCRPRGESFDLDFALLVATAPMDVRLYERAAVRLDSYLNSTTDRYDAILVDHRTGIATSVLPLMAHLPGPSVIFARTDSNLSTIPSDLKRVIRSIFESSPDLPGAYVSFSLDPNKKTDESLQGTSARIREALLSELALTVERRNASSSGTDVVTTDDMSANWIDWYLDRSLLEASLPDVSKLQSDNLSALARLREVIGLPLERKIARRRRIEQVTPAEGVLLSVSGAKDQGQFIHIPDLERLFVEGNPYSYVLGRKGTGKTRLLREMAMRGFGTPILVANDETALPAMRSRSLEANSWLGKCEGNAVTFWWSLIHLAVQCRNEGTSLIDVLPGVLNSSLTAETIADPLKIKNSILALNSKLSLLIDGLENLVPAAQVKSFVSGLFDVMATIQNDPQLSSRLIVRAFVREDLASDSIQNLEQQMEGRVLRLKWSSTSILNFAVSRLPFLPWINRTFKEVCNEILNKNSEIQRGILPEQEATELLLRIFPSRMRRNNLSTATFLRLYFSDAGGDDTNKATFYPRLYLSFLQKLDNFSAQSNAPLTEDCRIISSLLNSAYDEASSEFINETKQELTFLLSLKYARNAAINEDDQAKVSRFISAFDGLSTPFEYDHLVDELVTRTSFTEFSIRESLRQMKAIRMFEDRPGYAGWWRVGQLYKTGLRMKYVR